MITYGTATILLLLICLMPAFGGNEKSLRQFDRDVSFGLKGLFIVALVFYHSLSEVVYPGVMNFGGYIGGIVTAGFFFITGYGLCVSYMRKGTMYLDGFAGSRLGRILPKFFLLTLAMVIYSCWFENISLEVQWHRFVLYKHVPLDHSWFIYVIVFVYISFYLCARIFRKPEYIGAALTLILAVYYVLTAHFLFGFQQYWYMTIMAVSVGYYFALYEDAITRLIARRKVAVLSALCLGLIFVMWGRHYSTSHLEEIGYKWEYVINDKLRQLFFLIEVVALYIIIRHLGFFRMKWLQKLGLISLDIYLVHGIAFRVLRVWGLKNLPFVAGGMILSIVFANVLAKVFDKLRSMRK